MTTTSMNNALTAIDEAIALAPEQVGTPMPGRNGAKVSMVDILDADSLTKMLAAHKNGGRGPVYVIVIPKYAPKGTEGWVYTVDRVLKVNAVLTPLGGGRGLRIDPIALAEASAEDLRAYRTIRQADGGFTLGTGVVVRLAGERLREPETALWVITGLTGLTHMSVSRLGGGTVYPKIPRSYVSDVVPPQELAEAVAADGGLAA